MRELFSRFPGLARFLPHISIGSFPTPVGKLSGLCRLLCRDDLFIKRDDISAVPYGGNKVRKLEFLLADAKRKEAVRVITNGAAGSNHCLASALYARRAGLRATLILFDQPASDAVRANLLMDESAGAEMVYEEDYNKYGDVLRRLIKQYEDAEGMPPYVIPAGGSSAVGALWYVNAGFELKSQIERGDIPEPAAICVAFGTMGTVAGLAVGLRAAGLKSRIIASRVVPSSLANREKAQALCVETVQILRKADPKFPDVCFAAADIQICHDYFEPGYGLASQAVLDAVACIKKSDDIVLDITYTGKAFAVFLVEARKRSNGPLLFWNTKNSHPFPADIMKRNYEGLPIEFHRFFN
jgi:1-aminocyclopropane-1-carboxylate deaminase/D-cysteine desulfhydrase-like pyridoxal-dependent ACC family enzyme